MTTLLNVEKDIAACSEMVSNWEALEKALSSKQGKLILKLLGEGKDNAAKLTIHSDEVLRNQGLIGVQAHSWVEQHFDYVRQMAVQANATLPELNQYREDLINGVEDEVESNTAYEG